MGWKANGAPTVRKHRDKWAVRIDGIVFILQRAGQDRSARAPHRPRQGVPSRTWAHTTLGSLGLVRSCGDRPVGPRTVRR